MERRLTDLAKNETAIIKGFDLNQPELCVRLREIGFAEGDSVTPLHFGLIRKNPISVQVNGALIALRRSDAKAVFVSETQQGSNS